MIVFASRTGNVRYMVKQKLSCINSVELKEDMVVNQPYFLFTYTDKLGDIPEEVVNFLKNKDNYVYLKGVIASGNLNFGKEYFCKSADKIVEKHDIPIIRKIDLRGFDTDYEHIINIYNKLIGGI